MTSPIEHFSLVKFSWMDGSNLSCFVPFDVFRVIMTLVTILFPEERSSLSSVLSSVISPSQTYLVYLILIPMDLLKFSIKTSVFLTSEEKTSEATMGKRELWVRAIALLREQWRSYQFLEDLLRAKLYLPFFSI